MKRLRDIQAKNGAREAVSSGDDSKPSLRLNLLKSCWVVLGFQLLRSIVCNDLCKLETTVFT